MQTNSVPRETGQTSAELAARIRADLAELAHLDPVRALAFQVGRPVVACPGCADPIEVDAEPTAETWTDHEQWCRSCGGNAPKVPRGTPINWLADGEDRT